MRQLRSLGVSAALLVIAVWWSSQPGQPLRPSLAVKESSAASLGLPLPAATDFPPCTAKQVMHGTWLDETSLFHEQDVLDHVGYGVSRLNERIRKRFPVDRPRSRRKGKTIVDRTGWRLFDVWDMSIKRPDAHASPSSDCLH